MDMIALVGMFIFIIALMLLCYKLDVESKSLEKLIKKYEKFIERNRKIKEDKPDNLHYGTKS